jgi:hypothetical protein
MTIVTAPRPAFARPADGAPSHRARRLYIDSGQESVVYLHRDSELCRSEGFESETRVWVRIGSRAILATLNVVTGGLLAASEVGLSESAWAGSVVPTGRRSSSLTRCRSSRSLPLESLAAARVAV